MTSSHSIFFFPFLEKRIPYLLYFVETFLLGILGYFLVGLLFSRVKIFIFYNVTQFDILFGEGCLSLSVPFLGTLTRYYSVGKRIKNGRRFFFSAIEFNNSRNLCITG